jgi:aryl-alcohol dehydrogenase-like predicted oxidoreductase
MNLLEAGAVLTRNTGPGDTQTVLELARAEGLAVLVNRPLNAILGKGAGMVRLADLPIESAGASFDTLRDRVAALEADYRRAIAPQIHHPGQGLPPQDYFRWAEELTKLLPRVGSLEQWEQVEHQMIAPHLNQVLRALAQHLTGDLSERWKSWQEQYLPELLALLKEMRRQATLKSREKTGAMTALIDPLLPEARRRASLSQKALWVLASTPGVTCVLNGMRTPAYVDDSTAVLSWPPLSEPRRIYETIAGTMKAAGTSSS